MLRQDGNTTDPAAAAAGVNELVPGPDQAASAAGQVVINSVVVLLAG
jgi:hypothetical protein